jgi:hypothetical protein
VAIVPVRLEGFLRTIALLTLLLTSCGALARTGQTPVPGPTGSPTGSPSGTPIPGVAEEGSDQGPDQATTEEPEFPG